MKSLKFIVATVAFGVALSSPALAQQKEKGRGMPSPEQQIERIEQAVGSLTKEQKQKIGAIIAKTSEEMQKIPQEERREKAREAFQKQREEIVKVLTPEQQEKYRAAAAQRGGGGRKKN